MELVPEKESDQQNNNNNNSEKNNNTSYAQALVDSHDYNNKESDEFRERQARDLKAGLHPLKVFSLLSVYIIYLIDLDLFIYPKLWYFIGEFMLVELILFW